MSGAWSRAEVEATVADYLHMLTMELTGQQYNRLFRKSSGYKER